MDHLKIRSAGIWQGQGKRGAHWRGGYRRQEMSPCLVLLPLPWGRTEWSPGAGWKVAEAGGAQHVWEEQGPGSKISSLSFVFYSPPSFPQVGALSFASSNKKKHIQPKAKNKP